MWIAIEIPGLGRGLPLPAWLGVTVIVVPVLAVSLGIVISTRRQARRRK
jgi:hypothetical protein